MKANLAHDGSVIVSGQMSCVRKHQFPDERKAWLGLFEMRARKGSPLPGLAPYYCPHCIHWHLGNIPPRGIK